MAAGPGAGNRVESSTDSIAVQKPLTDQGGRPEAFGGNGRSAADPRNRAAPGSGLLGQVQVDFVEKGK
jgi:hypothetical protein